MAAAVCVNVKKRPVTERNGGSLPALPLAAKINHRRNMRKAAM